jgi:hypothetical protein
MAWLSDARGYIVDYGIQTTQADRVGTERGLFAALTALKTYLDRGWQSPDGKRWLDQCWIDSGYHEHTDPVYRFCQHANEGLRPGAERFRPSKGYGEGQQRMPRYIVPKAMSHEVRYIGTGYHLTRLQRAHQLIAHVNADFWKSQLHQRLGMPPEEPGAIVLYETADAQEHGDFIDQLTAERQIEKWSEGRASVVVWERIRRANHFLDASYAAVAAGHLVLALRSSTTTRRTAPTGRRTMAELAAIAAGR